MSTFFGEFFGGELVGRRGGESGEMARNFGGWEGGADATAFSAAPGFSEKLRRAEKSRRSMLIRNRGSECRKIPGFRGKARRGDGAGEKMKAGRVGGWGAQGSSVPAPVLGADSPRPAPCQKAKRLPTPPQSSANGSQERRCHIRASKGRSAARYRGG